MLSLQAGQEIGYSLSEGRQAYLIQIEGTGMVNGQKLFARDAAQITGETALLLGAQEDSPVILFDMKAE